MSEFFLAEMKMNEIGYNICRKKCRNFFFGRNGDEWIRFLEHDLELRVRRVAVHVVPRAAGVAC
jgi:hypothetical protein